MKLLWYIFSENKLLFTLLFTLLSTSILVSLVLGGKYIDLALQIEDLPVGIVATLYVSSVFTMAFGITPTTLVSVISGFLFGWSSVLPVISAYMLASALGFLLAKKLDNGNLIKSISKEHSLLDWYNRIERNALASVFFAKISPAIPFAVSNVLLSALNVKLSIFLLGSLTGMLPRTILAIWSGIQLNKILTSGQGNSLSTWLITILLMISIFGFYYILKKRNPT